LQLTERPERIWGRRRASPPPSRRRSPQSSARSADRPPRAPDPKFAELCLASRPSAAPPKRSAPPSVPERASKKPRHAFFFVVSFFLSCLGQHSQCLQEEHEPQLRVCVALHRLKQMRRQIHQHLALHLRIGGNVAVVHPHEPSKVERMTIAGEKKRKKWKEKKKKKKLFAPLGCVEARRGRSNVRKEHVRNDVLSEAMQIRVVPSGGGGEKDAGLRRHVVVPVRDQPNHKHNTTHGLTSQHQTRRHSQAT
jgi:hypothetical protein